MSVVVEVPSTGREWQQLREQRGVTVTDLSALTGLQQSTIHKLEAGGSVTRSTRVLVAAALGLPVFDEQTEAIA
jgi:transcriptional regulator with XRE-family HTH domain